MARRKSDREIRTEYFTAVRASGAIKRQFEKAGFGNVKSMRKMVDAMQGATTRRDMEKAIAEFEKYKMLETATVEGYKEKIRTTIAFWKEIGITGVTLRNFEDFTDFLEWTRSFSGLKYRKGHPLMEWRAKVVESWNASNGDIDTAFEIYKSRIVDV